ncbi:hypothetical protein TH5_03830 [Thalassospira xianhensis MCCC 1A02616]|uniref:Uncharacterized protein n=1 Tax=Thalassospira xianhensis MCCC 1A02616 TaxID=1177929 RepID=A0A367UFU3_9PROT|nr:hypothetical protein TH5_03830 [Thalassospira xianhensis MCCC 1A02616]
MPNLKKKCVAWNLVRCRAGVNEAGGSEEAGEDLKVAMDQELRPANPLNSSLIVCGLRLFLLESRGDDAGFLPLFSGKLLDLYGDAQ